MKSIRTAKFRERYQALPLDVQLQADKAYALFERNPDHPGLNFKSVGGNPTWYSARISANYRVVCRRAHDGTYIWFWIGSHAEYDQLLKLR